MVAEMNKEEARAATMRRIIRAYGQKIRRHGQPGSQFSFWSMIGGIDAAVLSAHIESHFEPGMRWSNYGEWQLRNIHPATEPVQTPSQFTQYVHYTNYRPKWAGPTQPFVLRNGRVVKHGRRRGQR